MRKLLNTVIGINFPSFIVLFFLGACQPNLENGHSYEAVKLPNPLEEYLSKDNGELNYELVHESHDTTHDYYVLRVESLNWLTEEKVDQTKWWHWVSVVLPKNSKAEASIVFIGGGSQNTKLPEKPTREASELAMATGAPTIYVHNIPFQPLNFVGDDQLNRTEDGIIAYGWRKFMEGGAKNEDAEWLARLPMTKAVITAVDAVAAFTKERHGTTINKYMVAGASKRGWTTWITAAMDERVIGMAPIVIDLLNLIPSFEHHWRSYGEWSPAIKDYEGEGIMNWTNTREYDRLLEITDPYNYLDRVRDIPKLLINASGDEFFLPDSWRFYWEQIEGEKHLLYVPNTGHSLKDTDAVQVLAGFFKRLVEDEERPIYSWEITDTHIKLKVDPENGPVQVKLWEATNPDARDFRIYVLGPKWRDTTINLSEDGNYEIPIEAPEKGWKGQFVELTYAGNSPIKVSTGIKVLPETYPYDPFVPDPARIRRSQ